MNDYQSESVSRSLLVRLWQSTVTPRWYLSSWLPLEALASKQQSMLKLLATAHRERCELVPLLFVYASEERGRYRKLVLRFARQLQMGVPLITAIEQTPDLLSEDTVLGLRFGSQSGTLNEMYSSLAEDARKGVDPTSESIRGSMAYWVVLFLSLTVLASFLFVFIFPTFDKLSQEMGLIQGMPKNDAYTYETLHWVRGLFVDNFYLFVALWLFIAFALLSSRVRGFVRRVLRLRSSNRDATGIINGILPLLAVSVREGRPIAGSLSTLAKYHYSPSLRKKLLVARNEVEHGVNEWKSLSEVGILELKEAKALQDANSNRMRAWILQQLAIRRDDLLDRRRKLTLQLVHPLVILAFAAFVLWICYSIFSFLTNSVLQLA